MRDADQKPFFTLMDQTAEYYDRKLTASTKAMYWQGLADLSIEAVRAALNAHMQHALAGKFMPKIADIRAALEANRTDDGHPGGDEAWSIALQARHENASVVWTDQIAQAFFTVALPLLDEGDKIAARKAFLERYEREIVQARKAGIVAKWVTSLGSDPKQREQAIDQAVRLGRLTNEYAQRLLQRADPITPAAMLALENGVQSASTTPEEARARTAALRAMLRLA